MNEPPVNRNRLQGYVQDISARARDAWARVRQPGTGGRILSWSREQLRELVAGVRFLTVIPVPGSAWLSSSSGNVVDSRPVTGSAYGSLIGLVIGLLLSLILLIFGGNALFDPHLPSIALAALVVVAQVILTGGLHLDGLMDSCDGLFGGKDRDSRLEIMRDSRVGGFGILGVASVLLLKLVFLSSMDVHQMVLALLVTLPAARAAMLLAVAIFPSARQNGLGSSFRQTVTLPRLLAVIIISLLIALIFGRLAGLLAWVISNVVAFLIGMWTLRRVGGLTGDIYGAIVEVSEVCALLVLVLTRFWL